MLRTNYFLKPQGTEQSIRKIAIVFLEKYLEDEPKVTLELNEVTGLYSVSIMIHLMLQQNLWSLI